MRSASISPTWRCQPTAASRGASRRTRTRPYTHRERIVGMRFHKYRSVWGKLLHDDDDRNSDTGRSPSVRPSVTLRIGRTSGRSKRTHVFRARARVSTRRPQRDTFSFTYLLTYLPSALNCACVCRDASRGCQTADCASARQACDAKRTHARSTSDLSTCGIRTYCVRRRM